jgi:hypothetical protein
MLATTTAVVLTQDITQYVQPVKKPAVCPKLCMT